MEEEPPDGADGTEGSEPALEIPPLPPELTTKEQEVRQLVEAGAASPEELRELAAKLQEKRTYEESLWQREVRPALMKSKKRSFKIVDLRNESVDRPKHTRQALVLLGVVVLLFMIATQTSLLFLLIPAAGVLVYAWVQGRSPDREEEPPTTAPDPPTDGS